MKCALGKDPEQWRLELNEIEAHLLTGSLDQLAEDYRADVDDLPEAVREYWRGRITLARDAGELKEAQQQLEEERLAWRGERLALVEKWLRAYEYSGEGRAWSLELTRDELEQFLMILNDRRLSLAAEHSLDENWMDKDWDQVEDVTLRQVLGEVHILAMFQGICLAALHSERNTTNEENAE